MSALTREEKAHARLFKRRKASLTPIIATNAFAPKERRVMRVTGPDLNATCVWERTWVHWFCVRAEAALKFMVFPHPFTAPRCKNELQHRGLKYQWIPFSDSLTGA